MEHLYLSMPFATGNLRWYLLPHRTTNKVRHWINRHIFIVKIVVVNLLAFIFVTIVDNGVHLSDVARNTGATNL